MRNKRKFNSILITMIVFTLMICTTVQAYTIYTVYENIKIETEDRILGKVSYKNHNLKAKKIIANNGSNVAYCIDIDKSYPKGETFKEDGKLDSKLEGILAAGYPNRTKEELGVNSNDDAYFATQIAIWSLMEGYDVHKITGDNPNVIRAIKTIYIDGVNQIVNKINYENRVYKINDEIQRVIVTFKKEVIEEPGTEEPKPEVPKEEDVIVPDENQPIMGK